MRISVYDFWYWCWLFPFSIIGQTAAVEPSVKVIADTDKAQVLLRWAVDAPTVWKRANTYGYLIERFTIARNGVLINPPERKVLTTTPLKPKPIDKWQTIVAQNDHAAIMAQALYGERFEVEGAGQEGAMLAIINQAKELDQRFSFALFAADMNFEVATMAGLGYVDTDVSRNERYFYKIKTTIPIQFGKVETGSVAVDLTKERLLPAPIDLFVVEGDKNIMLSWEYELYKSIYTSYFVERSENGIDFQRLGTTPLVNLNDRPEAPAKRMYYVDTLKQNNKQYFYRVVGVSPFGKESKPSSSITGSGKDKLAYTAHIKGFTLQEDGSVTLSWDFPEEGEPLISNFSLSQASNAKGPYDVVIKEIPKHQRTIVYDQLKASNYFSIIANGKTGTVKKSLPVFVQPVDSIPPKIPTGLSGSIDSLGITTLRWKPNTEKDLLGYRVFRANHKNEDPVQLTSSPIGRSSFIDTVQVASLNSTVYYSVVAVDKRYNTSDYTPIIAVEKPDVVPPSSPVFRAYEVINNKVSLTWIPSTSKDVVSHQLFRKELGTTSAEWKLIFQSKMDSSYTDTGLATTQKYRYAIFATDTHGLQSAPSTPITVAVTFSEINQKSVKGLQAVAYKDTKVIKVNWKNPSDTFSGFIVYKKKNEDIPRVFRELPKSVLQLEDTAITPNNTYTYYLKPILPNGKYGKTTSVMVQF